MQKKRASHPSSILEPILVFRKLVNKLEQAEIIKKLIETEVLNLEFENNFQTRTSQINHIHDSDNELAEKNHLNIKYLRKESKFQRKKASFEKWCNYCRRYGHSIAECRQKQLDNQNKPRNQNEPNIFLNL